VTDSPWFWVTLFCLAGLAVLLVARGQVDQRQTRIERQTQGRQRAAEMAATGETQTEMSTPGNTVVTIEPLIVLLVLGALVAGGMFWHDRRGGQHAAESDLQGHVSPTTDSSP
jgi:hypothetical protein